MHDVSIDISGAPVTFDLDLDEETWQSAADFAEADFPLVAEVNDKRYELYSDGMLDEVELP
jgi:hypothetical protein